MLLLEATYQAKVKSSGANSKPPTPRIRAHLAAMSCPLRLKSTLEANMTGLSPAACHRRIHVRGQKVA